MMELKSVRFEELPEKKVGIVKIARPEALNALNTRTVQELTWLFSNLKDGVRAVILTGEGEKAFVAGADIKEMENLTAAQALEFAHKGQAMMNAIENLPVPVIAAVNGFALGGGLELALACDFMLASNKCKWGLPEVTLGLIPGYGGTQRLSRVVGRALAKRVALSGEVFTAQQGYEWGVFTRLCEPVELMAEAVKLAEVLASRAPKSLAWCKEAVDRGANTSLAEGLKLEAEFFAKTFETKDHLEGIKAFIEKRPAKFEGH